MYKYRQNKTENRVKSPSNCTKNQKNIYINKILNNIKRYKYGDEVYTYLKNCGITKYNKNIYIYKDDNGQVSMVNLCYKFVETEETSKYKKTDDKIGFLQTIITKNTNGNFSKTKKQWSFKDLSIKQTPFVLDAIDKNNGTIYLTEGIENALFLRECGINNEIWYTLSAANFHLLPFNNNINYILILNKDYEVENRYDKYNPDIKQAELLYNNDNLILKNLLLNLRKLNNKHFSYLIPNEYGYSINDLLIKKNGDPIKTEQHIIYNNKNLKYQNRLKEFLENNAPIPLDIESSIKVNKTGTTVNWKPNKPSSLEVENDKLAIEFTQRKLEYNCDAIATRFAKRFGDLYKNVNGIGICKYNIEKGIYIKDSVNDLYVDIRETIKLLYFEYFFLLEEEKRREFKKFWDIWNSYSNTRIIKNVMDAIKFSKIIDTVEANDFDNNEILNLVNGYYSLKERKLYPHTKDKLFFKRLDVKYNKDIILTNPNAKWNIFLTSILCDNDNDEKGKEKIRFLQKAMGYTFSSSTSEEKLFIIKGVTRSGKSTFLESIQSIMADYCGDKQSEDFITQQNQSNNYMLGVLASLMGKRLLHISEISDNKKINSSQIKRLTGDQYITGKYLYEKSFSYKNQTKIWICTNSIDFTEFDDSIKTKIVIIDFDKRFYEPGTKEAIETGRVIDKTLKDKLLTDYNKEFILRWIIEGYTIYKNEGLSQTKEMLESIREIEIYNDHIGLYLMDNLENYNPKEDKLKNTRKTVNDIYNIYVQYEHDNFGIPQEQVITFRKFMKELRNRQFHIKRQQAPGGLKRSYIDGWRLKNELIIKQLEKPNEK